MFIIAFPPPKFFASLSSPVTVSVSKVSLTSSSAVSIVITLVSDPQSFVALVKVEAFCSSRWRGSRQSWNWFGSWTLLIIRWVCCPVIFIGLMRSACWFFAGFFSGTISISTGSLLIPTLFSSVTHLSLTPLPSYHFYQYPSFIALSSYAS